MDPVAARSPTPSGATPPEAGNGLHEALQRAEWNAQILASTEALARTGAMEITWPGGEVRLSRGLRDLIGQAGDDDRVQPLDNLAWVPAEERDYVAGLWRTAAPGEPFEFQHRIIGVGGTRLTVLHRGTRSPDGQRGIALLQDVTAQREAEQRIQALACQHEVTGLHNRAAFMDQADAALLAARWEGRSLAVLALEVPQILSVKGSMGFGASDTLAMTIAARLRERAGDDAFLAHVGEAEFAVVLEGEILDEAQASALATTWLNELCTAVRLGATDVFPQCLVGIALFPRDADTTTSLLEAAQAARLDAHPAQPVACYRPAISERARRKMSVEGALRQALLLDEFTLHYQPQVDLGGGTVRGAEALLRWHSKELGAVPPSEFIPIAERAGLSGPISEWVMRRVCADLSRWQGAGLPPVRVGVNLSPADLQRPDLAAWLQRELLRSGVAPGRLSIEITEGMVMTDVPRVLGVLHDLKRLGVEIALDDFGTGFSSLSHLRRLPIDVLKVDRSFVHDVTAAIEEVSVTRAIINLAHELRLQVLAEGVETEGELALLSSYGCDMMQGYLFSRPLPVAAFETLLGAGQRVPPHLLRARERRRTLLIVDDEANIVTALRRLLRRDGYEIVTAGSGEEGLRRLAEQPVDVILSDQRMPGMTGVEFLHRAHALYPDTVRMVLSGYTELQSILDAINEGAIYKFLTKPWDDERLRAHVAEAFRQKGLVDENRRLTHQLETANADLAHLNQRLEGLLGQQRAQADLLAASAGSMRLLAEELPAPLLALDPQGLVVLVNREALAHLPGAASWLGRPAHEAWPASMATLAENSDDEAMVTLGQQRFTVHRRQLSNEGAAQGQLLLFEATHGGAP